MTDRIKLLIDILYDEKAPEDERHDAAMDIGSIGDMRALKALIPIASNSNESDVILDACGESIAEIFVKLDFYDPNIIDQLDSLAKSTANAYLISHRPEWFEKLH